MGEARGAGGRVVATALFNSAVASTSRRIGRTRRDDARRFIATPLARRFIATRRTLPSAETTTSLNSRSSHPKLCTCAASPTEASASAARRVVSDDDDDDVAALVARRGDAYAPERSASRLPSASSFATSASCDADCAPGSDIATRAVGEARACE